PEEILLECYELSRANAADETGLDLQIFPEEPPFTIEEILDDSFLPSN
ncbi:MAG: DUF29 domain-containing protein, partial [Moorea sp. SIO2B7]|nr:DUF29 domain-containing protein [Moorena sp. SIO2B7]